MDKRIDKVFFETKRHITRPCSPNYPPQQANDGGTGNIRSLLSFRGISQLREKWNEYKQPKKMRRFTSLFISPRGEHVAVVAGNQITILKKEDDYSEPCGTFTSGSPASFTTGTWSESHDVLGVSDDTDTLYFIKANGSEIVRISRRQLKVSLPVISLIVLDDSDVQKSCLCSFIIITSDGSLQHIEISQDPSSSVYSVQTSHNGLTVKGQSAHIVLCVDYHPELSLLAGVTLTSGSCFISLWRRSGIIDLEQLFTIQFDGFYSKPITLGSQLAYPKVLISPQAKFVATLDLTGRSHVFKMDKESFSLSNFTCRERYESQVTNNLSSGEGKELIDIVDFTWWSDHILTFAKRSGLVTMLDLLSGLEVEENGTVYSKPVLERIRLFQGNLFLLETLTSDERSSSDETKDSHTMEWITMDSLDQIDISRLNWSLVSFSERSVVEMYNILLRNKKYQAALEFADHHGLDKDEVIKSQWLHSNQGANEISTFLSKVKDKHFVLSECVEKVGPTEDSVRALLVHGLHITNQYRFSEPENTEGSQIWDFRMARLKLLQYSDRLETYLGINMGRFSVQEYSKFRVMPIKEAAVTLAESGKIGALNLLFKRHPYSLAPYVLEIFGSIPETIPVQTYGQLLPGRSPPTNIAMREVDWVECEKMISFINKTTRDHEVTIQIQTEPIVKQCLGSVWPSINELSMWYKKRARDVDTLSGQLDNCISLLEFAHHKGVYELQQFHEDVSYLHKLIYSDESGGEVNLSLVMWEELSDYDKFKTMLKGVKEENMIARLHDMAVPFMRDRFHYTTSVSQGWLTDDHHAADGNKDESFLVRWLKEAAYENKLDICLLVIEEGCKDFQSNSLFNDEVEAIDCALQCIYLCTSTDKWSTMAAILSKLPQMQGSEISFASLERRLKLAEGHIDVGRLLAFYQVPKSVNFFLESHADGKGVKQILRLIISKFIRRQPSRSDTDWATMWRDMQCIREKAFPFLDLEYMLMEFCRGLLKAGKFSLARNYLKGTSSVALASDKAENLVIQAAREYFFSASSLSCPEIWKAKECLNIFPSSGNVKVESDIIDALTFRLPSLGVTLLPMQFRQIKDPMEIIKMAITSQTGAYIHVDELIEIAKLLGLSSPDNISSVQEAIAREAAVAGDLQLALDLCLVLAKKGHGHIWDLSAAIARGPALENMDINSRKQLLGFALSNCDEESVSELLYAWKDLDLQGQCETLMMLSETKCPDFSIQGSSIISDSAHSIQDIIKLKGCLEMVEGASCDDQEVHISNIKNSLSAVTKNPPIDNGTNLESLLRENGKVLSFAAIQLPWLLELSRKTEHCKKRNTNVIPGKQYVSVRTQALVTILSWLARHGLAPTDNVVASLAKSIIEPPVTEDEYIASCSFLLNLVDPLNGVEVIEEQLRTRKDYQEISSIMNMGMTYSLLYSSAIECESPMQRRELLLRKFKEKHTQSSTDEFDKFDKVKSTFWREWKLKLEDQKHVADHCRALEKIIPGVDTTRFLSRDFNYIGSVLLPLIDSVKLEKKHILKDILKLADGYGLNRAEVFLRYLSSVLVSEVWTNDDITAEISEFRGEIDDQAVETIKAISSAVYPAVDGCNKLRLAYLFGLLSDCYLRLEETGKELPIIHPDQAHVSGFGLSRFYRLVEQECIRVAFIVNLNFKNIAGLGGLNFKCLSSEVYMHVYDSSLEALSKMIQTFTSIYSDPLPEGLITWQDVYKHYIWSLLTALETKAGTASIIKSTETLQGFVCQLEQSYEYCRRYIRLLAHVDSLNMMKRYFTIILPLFGSYGGLPDNSALQECLIILLNFWIRLIDEMKEIASHEDAGPNLKLNLDCLLHCLKVCMRLVMEDSVSPSQGWGTLVSFINHGLIGESASELYLFCRAMIFSGCGFGPVAEVFSEAVIRGPTGFTLVGDREIQELPHLYLNILEHILQDVVISESQEYQNLYQLLSSLSKLEGDLEDLDKVRNIIWERMAEFSDNPQLPGSIRVFALELMQYLTGKNIKGFSAGIQSSVIPWEGWDEVHFTNKKSETTANQGLVDHNDKSSRFTSTLVALKSSQLVANISPTMEITPDDLLNLETAVSCFLKLCDVAQNYSHVESLLAVLGEWEGFFLVRDDKEASVEVSDAGNDWTEDNWDEGWESFQEVGPSEKENESSISINPLHVCWLVIFKKLITLSHFKVVLRLIDQSLIKSGGILLDEEGAKSLSQIVLEIDCFMALKLVLLLPFKPLQLQCLAAVEDKLKQGGISDTIGGDIEFLMLVLFSGVMSSIISSSSYGNTFSYICYLVGNLSHKCQAAQLQNQRQKGNSALGENERSLLLFQRVLFPCFISELVKGDQQLLAGLVVTKFMHTNASLSLVNIAEASLGRFLEVQLNVLHDKSTPDETHSQDALQNTISSLRGKMENLIRHALSLLSTNVR
ncbi:putative transcription factor WD40-like family [Rosa chinensis]|uniref:Putative transcription factor WD40-like family n=1 Tax=Rosa chinensis TaxID=74649 RepID=A0A2P6SPA7_ROSCH|nr:MAG2-interacting protein 2 [Rosa chinensis]PRQ60502.1 putative transcription factor WD40-like family [Rosa chinensis]